MNSTGDVSPTSHISVVNTRQPAVIQKITGVRREPGMRSDQIAADDHAEEADPVEGGRPVGGDRRRHAEMLAEDQRGPAVERVAQELEAEVDQAHRDDRR